VLPGIVTACHKAIGEVVIKKLIKELKGEIGLDAWNCPLMESVNIIRPSSTFPKGISTFGN